MPARRRTTPKVTRAAKRNIRRAQLSRIRTREPRRVGNIRRARTPTASRAGIAPRRRW